MPCGATDNQGTTVFNCTTFGCAHVQSNDASYAFRIDIAMCIFLFLIVSLTSSFHSSSIQVNTSMSFLLHATLQLFPSAALKMYRLLLILSIILLGCLLYCTFDYYFLLFLSAFSSPYVFAECVSQ